MRPFALSLAVGLAACSAAPDRRPDSAVVAAPATPLAAAPAGTPTPDAWLARADRVMSANLQGHLFLAAGLDTTMVRDCADDDGSDNPTLQAAVVAARIVDRTPAVRDSGAEYPSIVMRTTYHVQVTSAAIFVPQWIARFPLDSASNGEDAYEGIIAPRVDTFTVTLGEVVGQRQMDPELPPAPTGGPRWVECDPGGPAVSEGDGPGFWGYAHASRPWMSVQKWTPAGGSWAKVVEAAKLSGR